MIFSQFEIKLRALVGFKFQFAAQFLNNIVSLSYIGAGWIFIDKNLHGLNRFAGVGLVEGIFGRIQVITIGSGIGRFLRKLAVRKCFGKVLKIVGPQHIIFLLVVTIGIII